MLPSVGRCFETPLRRYHGLELHHDETACGENPKKAHYSSGWEG